MQSLKIIVIEHRFWTAPYSLWFSFGELLFPRFSLYGVQGVGIGHREELNCDVVAMKASDDPSRELWSWIPPSVLSQLEAKGLGFSSYTPHISHWADTGRRDLGLNGYLRKGSSHRGTKQDASAAATPNSWDNECLRPLRKLGGAAQHPLGVAFPLRGVAPLTSIPLVQGSTILPFCIKWVLTNKGVQE